MNRQERGGIFPPLSDLDEQRCGPLGRALLAHGTNFASLWALLSLCCFVLDLLTFVQGPPAGAFKCASNSGFDVLEVVAVT